MNKSVTATIGNNVRGVVQCQIVDARTKKVLRTFPKQNNLILNRFLDMWAGRTFVSGGVVEGWQWGFIYACAGDGTAPTQEDSGVTTATQTGTTVTLVGAFTFTDTATDAGKVIKWDSGQEAMIVSVTGSAEVEVNVSQEIPVAEEFTVYLCNQTKMGGGIGGTSGTSDIKRTSTYLQGAGNCGTTWPSPHIAEMKRTFDFTAEAAPVTYTEIGMSESNTVDSATLNVRVLLAIPVPLLTGQQLRLVYTFILTYSPAAATPIVADIPGWPVAPATDTNGTVAIEYLRIKAILEDGGAYYGSGFVGSDPGQGGNCYLSPYSGALVATPSQGGNERYITGQAEVSMAYEAYVPRSFECFTNCVFTPSLANRTDHRSLYRGYSNPGNSDGSFFRILFDQAQTKDDLHKLTVRLHWKASRTLS